MAEKLNKLNLFVNETTASTSARLLNIEDDMEKVKNDIGKMDKNMSKKILDLTRRNDKLQITSINIKDKTSNSPPELQENINSLNDNYTQLTNRINEIEKEQKQYKNKYHTINHKPTTHSQTSQYKNKYHAINHKPTTHSQTSQYKNKYHAINHKPTTLIVKPHNIKTNTML